MWDIPDDPIISWIERTGYPYWINDEYEEEEDREEEDEECEEEDEEYEEEEEVDYGED